MFIYSAIRNHRNCLTSINQGILLSLFKIFKNLFSTPSFSLFPPFSSLFFLSLFKILPFSFTLSSFWLSPSFTPPFLSLLIGGKALRIWGVARSHFLGEQVSTIWFPAPPSHLLSSSLLVTLPQGTLKNVFPLSPVRQQSPKGIQFFPLGFILPIDTFIAGFPGGVG